MTFSRDTGAASLPAIPKISVSDQALSSWVRSVTEWIEVRSGARGNPLERAVTKRELDAAVTGVRVLSPADSLQPGETALRIGGMQAAVSVDQFSDAVKKTRVYKDLMLRLDDPTRFDALQSEIRALILGSVANEAATRGTSVSRVEIKADTANSALAAIVEEVTAALGLSTTGVRDTMAAFASQTAAQAVSVTQLEASLGNYYQDGTPGRAALEQTLEATADAVSGLNAQYTLKVQAGGAIAGFGLAATEADGTPSSAFIISADKFAVVPPNYSGGLTNDPSTQNVPFGVDATGVYINGQVRIKATGPSLAEVASTSGIRITRTAENWRVNGAGQEMVISITLGILFRGSLSGTVTWSASGTTTPAPTNSNTWIVYAADQTSDTVTYTATLTVDGITYTDSVTLVRVRDGLPGAAGPRGDAGSTGSLTGYGSQYGIVSNSWSDTIANRVINNMLTGETLTSALATTDHLLLGDTVTLSNGSNFAETRYWSGVSWLTPGVVIDGNLLVNGTVSASKVTAGSIITGQSANANIVIGDTSFIGNIKSPFHVKKVSAASNQALISARNDTDDSVTIWGSSVYAGGNAVSGTWHDSIANANAGKWKLIGVLGSDLFNSAVAGSVYNKNNSFAGWFRYFSTESDSSTPVVTNEVQLATNVRAIVATGKVQLFGANSSLILGTNEGTAGQVLTSQGPGVTPTWTTPSGGGSVTYSNIQSALSPTQTSQLDLGATLRSTNATPPTSGTGIELAYYGGTGFLISATRTTGGSVSAYVPLQIQGSTIAFNVAPTLPTPATSTNNTTAATTAYVVSRIAQDAPTKTGSGASGTWPISISGNAATATNATTVGNIKVVGGSGTSNSSGDSTISTGLSTVQGFSAVALDGYACGISSVSGGNVGVTTRLINGGAKTGNVAFRWTATGT